MGITDIWILLVRDVSFCDTVVTVLVCLGNARDYFSLYVLFFYFTPVSRSPFYKRKREMRENFEQRNCNTCRCNTKGEE